MSVAVIIPTYNNLESLKKCLSALERQTFSNFNVYVCVDGSTDGTIEFLDQIKLTVDLTVIIHKEYQNRGRQATRNLGLRAATESYILFLDSDLQPCEHWISSHLTHLQFSPISIGRVQFTNTDSVWADYYNSRGNNGKSEFTQMSTLQYISANVGFRKEVFDSLGFMDESITSYGGDAEFAHRLFFGGYPFAIYNPNALVTGIEDKSVLLACEQYKSLASTILPLLKKKYGTKSGYFSLKKLRLIPKLEWECIEYWAKAIELFPIGTWSKLGVRLLLALSLKH